MTKSIKFEKGILIIGYCENNDDYSVYKSGEYNYPIKFTFIPNIEMTEKECLDYTEQIMPKIVEEAKTVILENEEFYKNFDFDYNSNFSGFSFYRHHSDRDLLIVEESWMEFEHFIKEEELSLSN